MSVFIAIAVASASTWAGPPGPTLATIAEATSTTVSAVAACPLPPQLDAVVVLTDQGLPRAAMLADEEGELSAERHACVHDALREGLRVPMPVDSRPAMAMLTYELSDLPAVVVPVGVSLFPLVGSLVLDPGEPAPLRKPTDWELTLMLRLGNADRVLGTALQGPLVAKRFERVLCKHQDDLAACGLAVPPDDAFQPEFGIVERTVLAMGELLVEYVYGTLDPDVEACFTTASAGWRFPSRDGDTRFAVAFSVPEG